MRDQPDLPTALDLAVARVHKETQVSKALLVLLVMQAPQEMLEVQDPLDRLGVQAHQAAQVLRVLLAKLDLPVQ